MDTVHSHGLVIADKARTGCYERALRATVRPGDVVLDLGTGTGIFAVLACHLGARQVFAVESSDAIWVARQVARANGCEDRITFIQGLSTQMDLPERANVIVSEIHGALPMYMRSLQSLVDARRRHLLPGGTMLPRIDRVWVAMVDAAEFYERHMGVWRQDMAGVDLRLLRQYSVNRPLYCHLPAAQIVGQPRQWATLEYRTLDSTHVGGAVEWDVERPANAHGLLTWFDCEVADGIVFSNHPSQPSTIFGQMFLPWLEPVSLQVGDHVKVSINADPASTDYCIRWNTAVWDTNQAVKARFRQTNFLAAIVSPDELRKRSSSHTPRLSQTGSIEQSVLEMMDGSRNLAEIAERLRDKHPAAFSSQQEALDRVADISNRCSE